MSVTPDQAAALILAGGLGTRVRHLLADLPKPMAPVLGRPFIGWVVRYLASQGVRRVVISTGYRAEAIEQHFEAARMEGIDVACVAEPAPMGTAGGFVHAARASGQRPAAWLVLNGDSLALAPLAGLFGALTGPEFSGALLGVAMEDASRYGTLRQSSDGELIGFDEKKPGAGIINAGVYLLRPDLRALFPDRQPLSFEKEVFPELIARKVRLKVVVATAPFLDIGTPESLGGAEEFIRANRPWFGAEIS